jgi:hypothetical protein
LFPKLPTKLSTKLSAKLAAKLAAKISLSLTYPCRSTPGTILRILQILQSGLAVSGEMAKLLALPLHSFAASRM